MLFCKKYLMCCFNLITPWLVMYCLRCGAREPKLARWVCNLYLWLDGVELLPVLRHPGWSWLEHDLRSKYLHLWQGYWKYLFNLSICFFFSDWEWLTFWTESQLKSNILWKTIRVTERRPSILKDLEVTSGDKLPRSGQQSRFLFCQLRFIVKVLSDF